MLILGYTKYRKEWENKMRNMGEYIKQLRKGAGLTQEELGQSLTPPVNKTAVNKWESGQVENIKRTYIKQLADKFGVKPSELMCFDEPSDSKQIVKESAVTYQPAYASSESTQIAKDFNERQQLRVLYYVARLASDEDIQVAINVLNALINNKKGE